MSDSSESDGLVQLNPKRKKGKLRISMDSNDEESIKVVRKSTANLVLKARKLKPTSPQTFKLKRNHEDLRFQGDYDAPILYPTANTCKADLLLQVTYEGVTKAYIPLHLEVVKKNVPWFAGALRQGASQTTSTFRESRDGKVELKFPYDPQHLCSYFKSIYDSSIDLDSNNAVCYHWIADYFNDEQVLKVARSYISSNINDELLFDVWDRCPGFEEVCINYVKKHGIRNVTNLDGRIGVLSRMKFIDFIKRVTHDLKSETIIRLQKIWLLQNYSDENLQELLFKTDFTKISMNAKFTYYNDIIQKLKPGIIQQVHSHIFKVSAPITEAPSSVLDDDTPIVTLLKYLDPSEMQIENANARCKRKTSRHDDLLINGMLAYQANDSSKNVVQPNNNETNQRNRLRILEHLPRTAAATIERRKRKDESIRESIRRQQEAMWDSINDI